MNTLLGISVLVIFGVVVQKTCNGWLKRHSPRDLLSMPLFNWSNEGDAWTLRDAVEGTLILGATGSGKSSGSGRQIATTMLAAGFGGLVLTAKSDERAVWEEYCRETGRLDDLIVFAPGQPHRFNFLDYEMTRKGEGAGLTENVVSLLTTMLEVAERNSGAGGNREDEGYFKRALKQTCRNGVDVLSLAHGRVAVPDLYRAVISAPTSLEQKQSAEWKDKSFCYHCLVAADKAEKTPQQRRDFEIVADYFMMEFPMLGDKLRGSIVSTFTSMIDVLNRGVLRELFCGETNLLPTAVEDGKIILVDLPVKEFAEIGQYAQVLWKHAFQRSIERRNITESSRPVFLFADEMQHFVTSHDQSFQTTCRAARVATVYLTQNVSNVYAALGGNEKGKSEAASLFANLNTKVFHANGDSVTNEHAATLIGRTRQFFANGSTSLSKEDQFNELLGIDWLGQPGTTTGGFSESFEFEVQPSVFTQLRTGGPANGGIVEGIVFRNGRTFRASGRSWLRVSFAQREQALRDNARRKSRSKRPVTAGDAGAQR